MFLTVFIFMILIKFFFIFFVINAACNLSEIQSAEAPEFSQQPSSPTLKHSMESPPVSPFKRLKLANDELPTPTPVDSTSRKEYFFKYDFPLASAELSVICLLGINRINRQISKEDMQGDMPLEKALEYLDKIVHIESMDDSHKAEICLAYAYGNAIADNQKFYLEQSYVLMYLQDNQDLLKPAHQILLNYMLGNYFYKYSDNYNKNISISGTIKGIQSSLGLLRSKKASLPQTLIDAFALHKRMNFLLSFMVDYFQGLETTPVLMPACLSLRACLLNISALTKPQQSTAIILAARYLLQGANIIPRAVIFNWLGKNPDISSLLTQDSTKRKHKDWLVRLTPKLPGLVKTWTSQLLQHDMDCWFSGLQREGLNIPLTAFDTAFRAIESVPPHD